MTSAQKFIHFKRNRFVAKFPRTYLYSPAHFWLCCIETSRDETNPVENGRDESHSDSQTRSDKGELGLWRVGLTHFATRMLGEIVEFDMESPPGQAIQPGAVIEPGEVIGWIEGMKAITDLFCVASGAFETTNNLALNDPELICKDPYGDGWLYAFQGQPDEGMLDVHAYLEMLGEKIDAMEEQPWKSQDG